MCVGPARLRDPGCWQRNKVVGHVCSSCVDEIILNATPSEKACYCAIQTCALRPHACCLIDRGTFDVDVLEVLRHKSSYSSTASRTFPHVTSFDFKSLSIAEDQKTCRKGSSPDGQLEDSITRFVGPIEACPLDTRLSRDSLRTGNEAIFAICSSTTLCSNCPSFSN